jgi:BstXI restriction endonuclease
MAQKRLPKLPDLLGRKISKTGQTRGADDDVIYQNRVNRSSTVLIPYKTWEICAKPQNGTVSYDSGFIVLLSPSEYFDNPKIIEELAAKGLSLGTNALVFYETREQWDKNNPEVLGWNFATQRTAPLGGCYVARIPATTSKNKAKAKRIIVGFHKTKPKGAGIRVYEYSSKI